MKKALLITITIMSALVCFGVNATSANDLSYFSKIRVDCYSPEQCELMGRICFERSRQVSAHEEYENAAAQLIQAGQYYIMADVMLDSENYRELSGMLFHAAAACLIKHGYSLEEVERAFK